MLSRMLDPTDEVTQRLDTDPQGLDAGFAIALAGEEPAELCGQADDLANRWCLCGRFLLVGNAVVPVVWTVTGEE